MIEGVGGDHGDVQHGEHGGTEAHGEDNAAGPRFARRECVRLLFELVIGRVKIGVVRALSLTGLSVFGCRHRRLRPRRKSPSYHQGWSHGQEMDNAAGPRFARREWAETADASGTCSEAVCICGLHPLTIGGRRPPPGSVLVTPLPRRAAHGACLLLLCAL